ncbi:unnamed protein product [Symbiodinium microadriaticum]|nr:unnamed protein product [Symbiodinium microadriaticum]
MSQGISSPMHRPLDIIVCYCSFSLFPLLCPSSNALPNLALLQKPPLQARSKYARVGLQYNSALQLVPRKRCGGYGTGVREAESERLRTEWGPYFREVDAPWRLIAGEVRYVDDVLRADDDSAYLAFIIDWYEDLPEYTVFLHADAPEKLAENMLFGGHIPSLELLTDSVYAAIRGFLPSGIGILVEVGAALEQELFTPGPKASASVFLGFVHFAHNYVLLDWGCDQRKDCEGRQLEPEFSTLWKRVFGASVAPSLAAGHVSLGKSIICIYIYIYMHYANVTNLLKTILLRSLDLFRALALCEPPCEV